MSPRPRRPAALAPALPPPAPGPVPGKCVGPASTAPMSFSCGGSRARVALGGHPAVLDQDQGHVVVGGRGAREALDLVDDAVAEHQHRLVAVRHAAAEDLAQASLAEALAA